MHELGLLQQILDKCISIAKKNHAKSLSEINLEIGDFAMVVDHLLQHGFEILIKNTIASQAKLVITRTPGIILCEDCHKESEIWFDPSHATNDPQLQAQMEEYSKTVTPAEVLNNSPYLGRNLFQCRHCNGRNTSLIKGKSILIKNIKVI